MRPTTKLLAIVLTSLPLALLGCSGGDSKPVGGGSTTTGGGAGDAKPSSDAKPSTAASATTEKAAPATEGWGTIKGRFVFAGATIPDAVPVTLNKDQEFCGKNPILSEEWVINKENKGVQWAAIWVRRPSRVHADCKPAETVDFSNENCVFKPHVLAFQDKTKVRVLSLDNIQHNTNIAGQKTSANPMIPARSKEKPTEASGIPEFLQEAKPFPVSCNIHGWMKAWFLCVDNPYFAVSNANGEFEIKNVPAGKLTLAYWHEKVDEGKPATKEIELKADETLDLGDWKIGG